MKGQEPREGPERWNREGEDDRKGNQTMIADEGGEEGRKAVESTSLRNSFISRLCPAGPVTESVTVAWRVLLICPSAVEGV